MPCCSEKICINGKTYDASFAKRPDGSIASGTYTDENFNIQAITAGSFTFGECVPVEAVANTIYNDYLCDNGFTRPYKRVEDNVGGVLSEHYRNSLGIWVALPAALPSTVKFGECTYQKHVAPLAGITLVASTNTITHNLNLSNPLVAYVAYDFANNNQQVTFDVGNFTANSFQLLNVPAGMAGMVIDIIVTGEG